MLQVKLHIKLPTYNRELDLRRAVNSVLVQSYTNWTLHISDNCSTDGTCLYLQQLSGLGDRRVKITRQHLPVSPHENIVFGVNNLDCQLFCWLGDDDWFFEADYFKKVAQTYARHEASLIYGARQLFNATQMPIGGPVTNRRFQQYKGLLDWYASRPKGEVINMSGVFMRYSDMTPEIVSEDPGAGWAWDEYMYAQCAAKGKVCRLGEITLAMTYRTTENNVQRESPLRLLESSRLHRRKIMDLLLRVRGALEDRSLAIRFLYSFTKDSIFINRILSFELRQNNRGLWHCLSLLFNYYRIKPNELLAMRPIITIIIYALRIR